MIWAASDDYSKATIRSIYSARPITRGQAVLYAKFEVSTALRFRVRHRTDGRTDDVQQLMLLRREGRLIKCVTTSMDLKQQHKQPVYTLGYCFTVVFYIFTEIRLLFVLCCCCLLWTNYQFSCYSCKQHKLVDRTACTEYRRREKVVKTLRSNPFQFVLCFIIILDAAIVIAQILLDINSVKRKTHDFLQ